MAKNIAVANDVYETLGRLKRENESFSDVIRRLLKKGSMLQDLAGRQTFTKDQWKQVEDAFKTQNIMDQKKREKLLGEVKKA